MNFLEFAASLVQSSVALVAAVAWPVVVAGIFWIFRDEFRDRISRIKRAEYLGGAIDFQDAIEDVTRKLDASAAAEPGPEPRPDVHSDPVLRIMQAWNEVERSGAIAFRSHPSSSWLSAPSLEPMFNAVLGDGRRNVTNAILELKKIRDGVVHTWPGNVTEQTAAAFCEQAARAVEEIQKRPEFNAI
ncbi:hypothetical protein [Bordetella bronchiseptica]|uniref:hypothetical protein n=1 Tax=Bordetella bronchiseptica TaxID=518 RepID=UPI0011D19125|nr:hypothetical protein [Bordetella bronchiseptica]